MEVEHAHVCDKGGQLLDPSLDILILPHARGVFQHEPTSSFQLVPDQALAELSETLNPASPPKDLYAAHDGIGMEPASVSTRRGQD